VLEHHMVFCYTMDCPAVTARSEEDTYAYEITLVYFEYETCTVIKRIMPVVCF